MTAQRLRVGFVYDAKAEHALAPGDPPDTYAEFDSEETISQIEAALATGGHEIVRVGSARRLMERVCAGERWDIIFNIAEGLAGRNRESQAPAICEVLGLPYTGSDALTMGITLEKPLAKAVVRARGLATPDYFVVNAPGDFDGIDFEFPLFVKPVREGSSKGITADSIAHDRAALARQTQRVIDEYAQPALVERFIAGQEFTVAVIGNDDPQVLPPVQVAVNGRCDLGEDFYTSARAAVSNNEIEYLCPAPASPEMIAAVEALAAGAYKALGCRDFSRIDIRVDPAGRPFFLECNPLPHLGLVDVFPLVARAAGTTYEKLICRILEHGIARALLGPGAPLRARRHS